ncbi:hypothetical protein AAC387_Pa09g0621 [Persea americana]
MFCKRGPSVSCRPADLHNFGRPIANRTPVRFHFQNGVFPIRRLGDAGAVAIEEERPEEAFEPPPAREWQPDDVL